MNKTIQKYMLAQADQIALKHSGHLFLTISRRWRLTTREMVILLTVLIFVMEDQSKSGFKNTYLEKLLNTLTLRVYEYRYNLDGLRFGHNEKIMIERLYERTV